MKIQSLNAHVHIKKRIPECILDSAIVDVVASKPGDFDSRYDQIRGKKIVVICCGLDGLDCKRFVFLRVQEIGIDVYLVEDPKNTLAKCLLAEGLIKELIQINMTQRATLVSEIKEKLKMIERRDSIRFDGVCTFWADAVTLGVRVQESLGTPGNSSISVDIAHNKHRTREVMRDAGLPTPKTMLLKCKEDAKKAAINVGVPGIMKPMYGAASLGVQKVTSVHDIVPMYEAGLRTLETLYRDGELMPFYFDGNKNSTSYLVYEEFLDGDEVDVDIVLNQGVPTYAVVADDWPQIEPWFAEMGNNCPSILPKQAQNDLRDLAIKSVLAMRFTQGVFHVELKNTSRGPRLIEVNSRMGGGPVWKMHKLGYGVDLIFEQLCASCGIQNTPTEVFKSPMTYVSCGEKFFKKSMMIPSEFFDIIASIKNFPNIVEAVALVKPGDKIIGIEDGFPTRTARFIVFGKSAIEAQAYAVTLLRLCEISKNA